jgi:hypothetical protein
MERAFPKLEFVGFMTGCTEDSFDGGELRRGVSGSLPRGRFL